MGSIVEFAAKKAKLPPWVLTDPPAAEIIKTKTEEPIPVERVNNAQLSRVKDIIKDVVENVKTIPLEKQKQFEQQVTRAIKKQLSDLLNAGKVTKKVIEKKAKAEKELAETRKAIRKHVKDIEKWKIEKTALFEEIKILRETMRKKPVTFTDFKVMEIPQPTIFASPEGDDLPSCAGIYFLWSANTIEYVGRSHNLKNRLKLGSHHRLREGDMISFIEAEEADLGWMEYLYIGLCKPSRNGGVCRFT